MRPNEWYYEFSCAHCGHIFGHAKFRSIHLFLGFETLCPECGTPCGSYPPSNLTNVDIKKIRYRRKRGFKWYNPATWGVEKDEVGKC